MHAIALNVLAAAGGAGIHFTSKWTIFLVGFIVGFVACFAIEHRK